MLCHSTRRAKLALAQFRMWVYFAHMRNSQWITTSAAHERSGVPRRTIIAAINRGDLPAQKLPGLTGAFLINPADLDDWAKRRAAA